ncbi:MAG: hypothetical protein QOF01_4896, partial [Thermomicrobiales bacterium]|nr:hypothetical protein [Thermomicrobiales bacterium]
VREGGEDEAVAVRVRTHQQHGTADRVEADKVAFAAEIVEMESAMVAPAVLVEGRPAGREDAVRLDDVASGREEALDEVGGIVNQVDVEPEHPIFVVQGMKKEVVAAHREDCPSLQLDLRQGAVDARREGEAEVAFPETSPAELLAKDRQSSRECSKGVVSAVALQHAEREKPMRVGQREEESEILLQAVRGVLDGCEDEDAGGVSDRLIGAEVRPTHQAAEVRAADVFHRCTGA